jgi:hypothetical protein
MSTKYLLTLLLMELTEELRRKDLRLDLEWVRRGTTSMQTTLATRTGATSCER